MTKNKLFVLLVPLFVFMGLTVIVSNKALAVGNVFPDNTAPCDFDVCANDVQLYTSNTVDVKIPTTVAAAYFTTANPTLRIYSPHLCTGFSQNDVDPGLSNGDNVTNFTFSGGGSASPSSFMGEKRSATSVCSSANNYKDITFTGVPRDPITGRYIVTITATHQSGAGGAQNAFKLGAISGGTISFKGAPSPTGTYYNVGMVQNGGLTPPNYLDYIAKFGADDSITVAAGQTAYLKWYDIDQAPSGAQGSSTDVTMELYEMQNGASSFSRIIVRRNAASDNGCVGLTTNASTWKPNPTNASLRSGCVSFVAHPGAKYEWRVYNVYNNNMIQLAVPFDGACYVLDCSPVSPATLTPSVLGANSVSRGADAIFTLHHKVTGFSAPNKTYTYNINYSFDGVTYAALPNDPTNILGSNVYSVRNRTLTISSDVDINIAPIIQFRPAFLAGHNKICIEFRIANGGGMTVAGNPGVKCTNIIDNGQYSITASATDHEKGSGNKPVNGTLTVNTYPCDASQPVGGVAATVAWNITGPNGFNASTTTNIPNCSGALVGNTLPGPPSASGAYLDTLPVGGTATYTPAVTSYGAAPASPATLNPVTINVYAIPYARFSGNDIYACGGSGIAAIDGRIIFNVSGADTSKGAAVEYAALALSGFGLNTAATSPDITTALGHGVATALKGDLVSGTDSPCTTNVSSYYPTTATGAATANIPAAAGYYTTAGNLTITGGTTTKKVTIHATGNITITGNNIGATGAPVSPFVDDNNVPYVLIIADGNILIDPSVTTINAVLVAGGTISTCATGNLTTPTTANLNVSCNSLLTINGAMSAKNILYRRSIGTRLLNDTPAEVINFPTYLHFATPFLDDTSGAGYQSLFNAAPYL